MRQRWIHALTGWILRQVFGASDSVTLRAASAVHVALNLVVRVLAAFHVCITFELTCRRLSYHHELVRVLTTVKIFIGNLRRNRRRIEDVKVRTAI